METQILRDLSFCSSSGRPVSCKLPLDTVSVNNSRQRTRQYVKIATSRTKLNKQCVSLKWCSSAALNEWQQEILSTYPEPETEKERSSVDYPQEWITPQPSRRPDPLPEFERLETPPPRKMPGDPEQPDEEEEEEKEKEKPEEDPEEQPEQAPTEE